MKTNLRQRVLFLGVTFLFLNAIACVKNVRLTNEPMNKQILSEILFTKMEIERVFEKEVSELKPVFLTFFDFDGTILKGFLSPTRRITN